MIQASALATTAIGVVIVICASALLIHAWRLSSSSRRPSLLIASGLGLVGVFHLTDLLVLWMLPLYAGEVAATALRADLHGSAAWIVWLLSVPCVAVGCAWLMRGLDPKSGLDAAARSASVLEAHPEGLLTVDRHGRIDFVNDAAVELFGICRGELLGQPVRSLFVGEEYRARPSRHASGNSSGQATAISGDNRFPARVDTAALPDGRELITVRDMTEALALEVQLRQAQKMESLGRLAGGVAHDFNNHLTVILGETEFLGMEGVDVQTAAKRIQDAATRSANLTRQLLAFSRKQVLDLRVVEIDETVASTYEMLRNFLPPRIELVSIPGATPGRVRVDSTQLEQSLLNLTLNARDAIADRGTITLETGNVHLDRSYTDAHPEVAPGAYVMLALSDSGSGMPPAVLEHAAEPFFSTKPRGAGTGLGLAMVMGVVRQSGGSLSIESEPEVGTTVRIYLPRVDASADPPVTDSHPRNGDLRGSELILVAEDDAAVRQFVEEVLRSRGYAVRSAGDVPDALALLDDEVDLLLTDIDMPSASGTALAERATEARPELPVVYITGYGEHGPARRGLDDAGARVLQKPFSVLGLLRAVRQELGAHSRRPGA